MRGSIIVISRLIDVVQIQQGILKRKVYAEENWAVVFALLAVAPTLLPVPLAPWFEQNPAVAKMLGIDPRKLKAGWTSCTTRSRCGCSARTSCRTPSALPDELLQEHAQGLADVGQPRLPRSSSSPRAR